MERPLRIALREAIDNPCITGQVARASSVSDAVVLEQVTFLNQRLRAALGLESPPIVVSSSGAWRADGVAGLLRLNPNVELEVVPKFLTGAERWREDFFLIAVLARTGRLLVGESVAAGISDRGDLATLVARTLINMHVENQRRPLRGYRSESLRDFSLDGEVELDTLSLPDPDGFTLNRLKLSRDNAYNGVLRGALVALLPEVADGDTRSLVERQVRQLGPQAPPPAQPPTRLPSRHAPWQQAYELSRFVLAGMGLDLSGGTLTGPGFVVATWAAWQSLCEEVLRRAFPEFRSVPQHPFVLGTRTNGDVVVKPDVTLLKSGAVALLLDAKYKTRIGKKPAVSSSDLYEALAFMRAADCSRLVLLYPSIDASADLPTGGVSVFEELHVDGTRIDALAVQVRGLSTRGGFEKVVKGMRASVTELVPDLALAQALTVPA